MATPFKVKAIYEYASEHDDDLKFSIGQIITVTEEEDDDWYVGEYVDDAGAKQEGIFPRNFVEKYEPTAPPRPTRTRTKKDAEHAPAPAGSSEEPATPTLASPTEPAPKVEDESAFPREAKAAVSRPRGGAPSAPPPKPAEPLPKAAEPTAPSSPPAPKAAPAAPSSPTASKPAPAPPKPNPGPPAPSEEKPIGSFRDRIAAFNKAAAPPVAPFKPSGLSSSSGAFVKKPFVAPPPSRNSYVPPARDVPTAKVYRRDEDPEIKEREAENLESAEKAGLVPGATQEGGDEEEPKPMMSLK